MNVSILYVCSYTDGLIINDLLSWSGTDVTLVGYGAQIQRLRQASAKARDQLNISCEVVDLRTLQPWDIDTVANVSSSQ